MKLMFIILRDNEADQIISKITAQNLRVTRVASTGGFLKRGNITLMIGLENNQVDAVIDLLKQACSPPDENGHHATVFVVNMTGYQQI